MVFGPFSVRLGLRAIRRSRKISQLHQEAPSLADAQAIIFSKDRLETENRFLRSLPTSQETENRFRLYNDGN